MAQRAKQVRAICFTLNNYTKEEVEQLSSIDYSYIILGHEISKTGTHHIQGYIELKRKTSFNIIIKKIMPKRAHVEIRRGTAKQASDYCKKGGQFIEYGKISRPGTRNDILLVREILKNSGKMSEVTNKVNSYQACRHAELILKYNEKERDFKSIVFWFYGDTGMGKTRTAKVLADYLGDTYICDSDMKWFCGYDAHDTLIIDDFRGYNCKFNKLLKLLDRSQYRLQTKGGSRQLLSKYIFITCPCEPRLAFINMYENLSQLYRRITAIVKF